MTIPTIEKYLKRCGPWVAIQESPVRHFKEYRRIHHLEIYIYINGKATTFYVDNS